MPSPDKQNTRKLLFSAVLCAFALALSLLDTAVSSLIPFLPGFKLGLANVVTLYALYTLGGGYALLICIVRVFLAAALSGNMTMLLFSLFGGVVSLLLMWGVKRLLSMVKTSVVGGVAHNMMQVLAAFLLTDTPQVGYYIPFLIIAGAVSGFCMGVLCGLILRRLPPKAK
ncbi:MAG: Gx transporter family protein [Christensenellaceae bacterium]|jgi:heptaprenyl diphosphate synthase